GAEMTGANLQARAREARYGLLEDWCRAKGVLHLLVAHHRDDQAETFVMRLGRGSGSYGLAAMAPVSDNPHLRLLRPLLGVPRECLVAFLQSRGLDWVEDPSNEDASFARVRVRRLLPELGQEGLTEPRLAATARRMARARVALESAATELLARAVAIYPEGYAVLKAGELRAAPEDTGLRALSRLLTCIGGNRHGPRMERLERLYEWLSRGEGGGRTLAGCRIVRRQPGHVLVCREAAAAEDPVLAAGGILWDGRFRLSANGPLDTQLGRLGPDGWAQIRARKPDLCAENLPADVRNAIPAIWSLEEVVAVPHLHYCAIPLNERVDDGTELTFLPPRSLGAARFSAVPGYA
ncbi:MAG: tRNA lysidine(34) synthetase TilS, partial [Pseudomonadota bacterium]